MKLSNRPYDVLRIDFCDPAKALPTRETSTPDDATDDFNDHSVFSDPQVVASISVAN